VDLPVTERLAGEIVSLPIFASLTDDEVERVITALLEWERGDANPRRTPRHGR
jgi:dTDP-4-amino-4,6-dideoxygalactose transaminase